MIKLIKRTLDNKFLSSLENDIWVENKNDAFEMTYRECEAAKETLLNTYGSDDIKDVVIFNKTKTISEEEKQELLELLKK